MRRLFRIILTCVFCLSAAGVELAQSPATQPTTAGSQRTLKQVDLYYEVYLARIELRITVARNGRLRSARTLNKRYGTTDGDATEERTEIREGTLNAKQISELAGLFVDWDSLSSDHYGGVPDGGEVRVRYGDKSVSGGSHVPAQVTKVREQLVELAESMPVVHR